MMSPPIIAPCEPPALDVQNYIGSCLISQKPHRGKKKSSCSTGGGGGGKYQGNATADTSVDGSAGQMVSVTHSSQNRGHVGQTSVSSAIPICDCCGGYKSSGHINSAWAGAPLFSMANSGGKKKVAWNNVGKEFTRFPNNNNPALPPLQQFQSSPPTFVYSEDRDKLSMSSLAMHTQGAPLILAGNKNGNGMTYSKRKCQANKNNLNNGCVQYQYVTNGHIGPEGNCGFVFNGSHHGVHAGSGSLADPMTFPTNATLKIPGYSNHHGQYPDYSSSATLVVVERILESLMTHDSDESSEIGGGIAELELSRSCCGSSSSTSDCMSITSEESSSCPSEHSLPRIIKPRKRRKRDRKTLLSQNGDGNDLAVVPLAPTSGLVTLKPYTPLCFRFQEASGQSEVREFKEGVEEIETWNRMVGSERGQSQRNEQRVVTSYPYPPSRFCTCRLCTQPSSSGSSNTANRCSPFLTPPPSPPTSGSPPIPSFDSHRKSSSSTDNSRRDCQVSTRIVTAPNGNRDLEIKFLSGGGDGYFWSDDAKDDDDVLSKLPTSSEECCTGNSCSSPSSAAPSMYPGASDTITASHPPQRPWIQLANPDRRRPVCIFTVMCYNVLCDKYATRQMYGYCPNWALGWEYRRKGILDEIRHYSADIISLQELETDQFYNFFLPELKNDGYDGIFSPKSRAKTMIESERKYVDGCAIFFRTNKFSLIKEHLVEFNQLAMANADGSDDMLNRVMTKDNIGLAALLQTKDSAWENGLMPDPSQVHQAILVCTAHIHWDPEYCDVKLIQTMMLMHELRTIVEESGHSFRPGAQKPDCNNMPLILCGDFNSLPDSGVIEYLTSSCVSVDHCDFKELGYKACLQKLSGADKLNEFTHSFKLGRAYADDVMPFTNYTFDFKGIIDYILYSKQFMTPLGVLGALDPDWLREHKVIGCPHPHIPSDHFSLLVELEITAVPTGNSHPPLNSNGLVLRR